MRFASESRKDGRVGLEAPDRHDLFESRSDPHSIHKGRSFVGRIADHSSSPAYGHMAFL